MHIPAEVEDFTQQIAPELQRRGLHRTDHTGQHLLDHLGVRKC